MSSSFKRREPRRGGRAVHGNDEGTSTGGEKQHSTDRHLAATDNVVHTGMQMDMQGLRPSPFPSTVPLFSSGLASLDDLICGYGVPSSSVVVLCPSVGLASAGSADPLSAEDVHLSQPSSLKARQMAQQRSMQLKRATSASLRAAERAAEDVLCYGVAQGIVAGHDTILAGRHAETIMATRVPAYALSSEARRLNGISDRSEEKPMPCSKGKAKEGDEEKEEELRIAFRYSHRPKFKTTVEEPEEVNSHQDGVQDGVPIEHQFRAPFDMSKRWSAQEIRTRKDAQAGGQGCLCFVGSTSYDDVLRALATELTKEGCAQSGLLPAARIHLFSLGSLDWSKANEGMDRRIVRLTRFLFRLRALIKRLSLDRGGGEKRRRHVICSASLSSDLLNSTWRPLVTRHIARIVDVQILLSDFSSDQRLSRAYAGYEGSVYLLKGPSIGSVLPPGENRSVLRGGSGEAGAENDVGWRRKRRGKGIVFETLHEDVDADLNHPEKEKSDSAIKGARGDDIEESASGLQRRANSSTGPQEERSHPIQDIQSPARIPSIKTTSFGGLKSLRDRGLRASSMSATNESRQRQ